MPTNPTMYLHSITLTMLDDLYDAFKQAAVAQHTSIEALLIEATRASVGLGPSPRLPIETLREKLIEEMELYVRYGVHNVGFLTQSPDHTVFATICIDKDQTEHFADFIQIVRIVNDIIVIEQDKATDKPLVDALLQAGVPRRQIILVYAGEPRPLTA